MPFIFAVHGEMMHFMRLSCKPISTSSSARDITSSVLSKAPEAEQVLRPV